MSAKAFLLAAGFGTRLRPLTEQRPKPLVPLCGQPLANYALALLERHGIRKAVVNAHYLPEKIEEWAETQSLELDVFIENPNILGTGGGLKNAVQALDKQFVVVNGDILSNVDLTRLLAGLKNFPDGPAAMMALRKQQAGESYGIVASDAGGCVVDLVGLAQCQATGFVDRSTHFTGIHALNQDALQLVPDGEACIVRTAYTQMTQKRQIGAISHQGLWVDIGTPERYLAANMGVLSGQLKTAIDPLETAGWALSGQREGGWASQIQLHPSARLSAPFWIGEGAEIGANVELGPGCIVGQGARIGAGAKVRNSVVWEHCVVENDACLEGAIVHDAGVLRFPNTSQ